MKVFKITSLILKGGFPDCIKNILPIYSPIIPIENKINPVEKNIDTISAVNPL